MKNKRIIICDIDGTLADSDTEVSDEILNLISKLQKKYIFVTMGNGHYIHLYNQFLKKYIEKVGKEIYIFPLGGLEAYKTTPEGIVKLYSNDFSEEEKRKIVRTISDFIREKKIEADTYDQIEDRGSMIVFSALGRKADKELKKNYDPDKSKRQKFIEEDFKEKLPECEIKIGGTTTLDFTKKGITKAFGIEKIKNMFKINFEDMIYFGDDLQEGGNDHAIKEFVEFVEVKNPEDTFKKLKKYL
ncbi:MAG: HAD-IIB family hydrolase [archaeon]